AVLSPALRGVQEKALRASFCKLLKLLLKDDLVGMPVFVFCLARGPETDIRGSLEGELILTAIALAAYIATVFSSAEPPKSNEDAHAGKNISAAMATARLPKHEDPRPMS
ncbi:hypothetical protein HYC85_023171, partial [Camellia sinensis]